MANLSFLLLGDCLVIGKKVVENAVMNVSLGWNYGQYKRNMQAFRPELYTLKRVLHLKNYHQNLERMVFNFCSKVVFKSWVVEKCAEEIQYSNQRTLVLSGYYKVTYRQSG